MTSLYPFSDSQVLHYAYLKKKHYLGNGSSKPEECSSDIRSEIEKLIRNKPYSVFLIKAENQSSLLELQLAFDGSQDIRVGEKLVRLLRCSLDGPQENT